MRTNYKIIVHYDGTNYKGWQQQGQGLKTIQGELVRVLKIIAKKKVLVTGSSRTDAGVHSTGLTANFFIKINIEADSLKRAFNSLLPDDIRIVECEKADYSFNARFGAKEKTYTYRIFYGSILSPFKYRYHTHIPYLLNINLMRRSIKFFIGEKNFSSFTSDEPKKNRIREINEFTMKKRGEELIFEIRGKSFLRYMVRNMMGTIIDVGRGKIDISDIPGIFEARDRRAAGQTAPARGLTLTRVDYE